jgi:serine protease Do
LRLTRTMRGIGHGRGAAAALAIALAAALAIALAAALAIALAAALAIALAAALAIALAAAPASAGDPFLRHTVTVDVVRRAGPSVVSITSEQTVARPSPFQRFGGDPFFDRFFHDFFEPRLPQTTQSLGSGVLIDADRRVLTNEHVVARASRIRVTLADGREYDATLVGADPNNDLAVLRLETGDELPWIPLGSSADLMVGEPVIAIGNPFGLSHTVTTGVVSALNRSIRSETRVYHGFLQTDASINPGNSGGPLLNAEGRLVAINTAVYGGADGIGFAIPIDVAGRVVAQLIAHGELSPVWIGIEVQELDENLQHAMELRQGIRGVVVNRVRGDSPADRAGIRRGDVLVRLDHHPVAAPRSVFEILDTATPGQELPLDLWRDGQQITVSVRAEEAPVDLPEDLLREKLGLELRPAHNGGYEVTSVRQGSGAERIGVRRGDLVLGINGLPLDGEEALRRASLALRGLSGALVVVQRGNGRYHVTIPFG